MVRQFCLFKVLAVPPKRLVAAPAWVIRVALRRLHFLVQRIAAPPDWARCSASLGIWSVLQRVCAAHCGACLFMRGALRRPYFHGAARCSTSSSGTSRRSLRDLECLAAPPSSAWQRPLGNFLRHLAVAPMLARHGSAHVLVTVYLTCTICWELCSTILRICRCAATAQIFY